MGNWLDDLLGYDSGGPSPQVFPAQNYNPYQLPSWLDTLPAASRGISSIFQAIQEPVNVAAGYYSGLPDALNPHVEPPSIGELGGGSLRDLAASSEQVNLSGLDKLLFSTVPGFNLLATGGPGIENPYALAAIEKIGGESLEELSDPTNIPGALVGAGSLVGRSASTLDKMFAGMGAVSGLGGGLPVLGSGVADVSREGINPENFSQILEGLMGVGFGSLSAAGLSASPDIQAPSISDTPTNIQATDPLPFTPEFDSNLLDSLIAKSSVSSIDPETLARDVQLMESMAGIRPFEPTLFENLTESLPFKYDPSKLGMGLGGLTFSENVTPPIDVTDSIQVEPDPIDVTSTIQIQDPKADLSSFVSQMKEKYEGNWRKKLDEIELSNFNNLQLAVQGVPDFNQVANQFKNDALKAEDTLLNKSTPIIPPDNNPPIEIPKPPAPPPVDPENLTSLGLVERATLPTLRNITKASPTIGKAVKSYDEYHTEIASENIADIRDATKGVNKGGEQKIIRWLDGEKINLNAHEKKVAVSLRKTLDTIANLAEENQVLVGYRQGYFPRKYEDRFEWDISPKAFGSKNMPLGSLEKSRQGNRQNFRRDFKVLEEYVNEATRRISESKYLGKDLSKVTGKQFSGDRPTVEFIEKGIARITGRERSSTPARFADKLRRVTALGDLAFASIYQPAQFAHTASAVGLRRAIRAVGSSLKDAPAAASEATRSGALWPNISHEVSKAVGDKGYMHGIPTMDKVMRVHASVAGRILAEDALKGNSYARRQIQDLGLSLKDPKLLSKASRLIADKTQFRTGTLDMPLWTHSPLGKLASQYTSFAYAHARFMTDAFKHPVRNFGQIIRFAAMGLLLGEGVGDLREAIRSIFPGKDEEDELLRRMMEAAAGDEAFDDKDWLKKLQAVTRSKRIPTSSPGWRALQNLSMVGGIGIFQSILEKATSGRFWQLPIGPAGSLLVDTAENLKGDIQKGVDKDDWRMRGSLKNLVSNLPLPLVSGRKIADSLFPTEKSKRPFGVKPKKTKKTFG